MVRRQVTTVIVTMIFVGLVFGRWWRTAIVAGAVLWPVVLLVTGLELTPAAFGLAVVLGAANTAVGVLVHQALLALVRWYRARRAPAAA